MAIESANTFATNRLATMVAVRAAEEAAYLTVGSKAYFKNQLADSSYHGPCHCRLYVKP